MNIIKAKTLHTRKRHDHVLTIIIHYISARYTMPDDPYNITEIYKILNDYKVSYHEIVDRDGTIYQLAESDQVAWHAGTANVFGHTDVNSISMGLAYVGIHENHPTDIQYRMLARRCKKFMGDYKSIKPNWIFGHDMVAGDWVRGEGEGKIDPGPNFNYAYLYRLIF